MDEVLNGTNPLMDYEKLKKKSDFSDNVIEFMISIAQNKQFIEAYVLRLNSQQCLDDAVIKTISMKENFQKSLSEINTKFNDLLSVIPYGNYQSADGSSSDLINISAQVGKGSLYDSKQKTVIILQEIYAILDKVNVNLLMYVNETNKGKQGHDFLNQLYANKKHVADLEKLFMWVV